MTTCPHCANWDDMYDNEQGWGSRGAPQSSSSFQSCQNHSNASEQTISSSSSASWPPLAPEQHREATVNTTVPAQAQGARPSAVPASGAGPDAVDQGPQANGTEWLRQEIIATQAVIPARIPSAEPKVPTPKVQFGRHAPPPPIPPNLAEQGPKDSKTGFRDKAPSAQAASDQPAQNAAWQAAQAFIAQHKQEIANSINSSRLAQLGVIRISSPKLTLQQPTAIHAIAS